MTEANDSVNAESIAKEIAGQAADAVESGRPLFLIVYYEHEAVKIAFQGELRQALNTFSITPQTFDPAGRPEHGTGQLYGLLSAVAETKSLALITGLPRLPQASELDPAFLEYLNLHRDLISKKNLRFVLFLHMSDAETFISGAGDLWDFRHHTYWLEGRPEAEKLSVWEFHERASSVTRLTEEERSSVNRHLESVHSLIRQTSDSEEKAALFLDLSEWLSRRNLPSFAADAAFEGIHLLPDAPSALRGNLEFALGRALRYDNQLADALRHYQNALAIRREVGDRAGEAVTCSNLAMVYRRRGELFKAVDYARQTVAIEEETNHPDLERHREFLKELENALVAQEAEAD